MKLNRNERTLSLLLALIVIGGGGFFGWRWLSSTQQNLSLKLRLLEVEQAEAKAALRETDRARQRQAWITAHQPGLNSSEDAGAKLLQEVLKTAREQNLTVRNQKLGESTTGPGGVQSTVEIEVKGPMEGLARWLINYEVPTSFCAITHLNLRADEDQKSMVCLVRIVRYHRKT